MNNVYHLSLVGLIDDERNELSITSIVSSRINHRQWTWISCCSTPITGEHLDIRKANSIHCRDYRVNDHCQMLSGHIHNRSMFRLIYSIFVLTIFRSIQIFRLAILSPEQFNDTNHFSFHRNYRSTHHHLMLAIFCKAWHWIYPVILNVNNISVLILTRAVSSFVFHFKWLISQLLDNLTIDQTKAIVKANSVWGLLRGLETFSQLIYINEENYVKFWDEYEYFLTVSF